MTVLLIDDDDGFRKMAHRMLVAAGYDVQDAADGKAGLACYRRQRSDVVITDILMPEKDGLEAIQELRRYDPHARIIAVSGAGRDAADAYLKIALKFGARLILYKPFTRDDLLSAVTEVLATSDESGPAKN